MRVSQLLSRSYLCVRGTTLLRSEDPNPCGVPLVVVDADHRPLGVVEQSAGPRNDRIPAGVWHPSMFGSTRTGARADVLMRMDIPVVSEEDTLGTAAGVLVATGAADAIACDADGRVVGIIGRDELACAHGRSRALDTFALPRAT